MELREYFKSRRAAGETMKDWCARNGLHPMSVTLVANGHRKAGAELAKKISAATGGVVPLAKLRPDIWG